jgi:hypothetical protein
MAAQRSQRITRHVIGWWPPTRKTRAFGREPTAASLCRSTAPVRMTSPSFDAAIRQVSRRMASRCPSLALAPPSLHDTSGPWVPLSLAASALPYRSSGFSRITSRASLSEQMARTRQRCIWFLRRCSTPLLPCQGQEIGAVAGRVRAVQPPSAAVSTGGMALRTHREETNERRCLGPCGAAAVRCLSKIASPRHHLRSQARRTGGACAPYRARAMWLSTWHHAERGCSG